MEVIFWKARYGATLTVIISRGRPVSRTGVLARALGECLRRMKWECGGKGWRSKKYSVVSVGRGWALYITPRPLSWTDLQKAGGSGTGRPWECAPARSVPSERANPAVRVTAIERLHEWCFPGVGLSSPFRTCLGRCTHPLQLRARPVKKPKDSSGRSKRENAPALLTNTQAMWVCHRKSCLKLRRER